MFRSFGLSFLLIVLLSIQSAPPSIAQSKFPFGRSKSAEETSLTEKHGPWLIMVASFSGDDGAQQASRLANELKTRHGMKAYTYTHNFDFDVKSKAFGYADKPRYDSDDSSNTIRVSQTLEINSGALPDSPNMEAVSKTKFSETAVLIGDFGSIEDSQAQKALTKIKTLKPECFKSIDLKAAQDSEELSDRLKVRRHLVKEVNDKQGPLHAAFLLANPLIPEEFFQARKLDKLVLAENVGAEYSLLDNPGIYSVKVATFSGDNFIVANDRDVERAKNIKESEEKKRRNRESLSEGKLANATKKAILLARELRRQGHEAYAFHDHHESYVCVGSFEYLTKQGPTGAKINHPDIEKTILNFKSQGFSQNKANGSVSTKSFPLPKKLVEAGITCDLQPIPVLVPKYEPTRTADRLFDRFR